MPDDEDDEAPPPERVIPEGVEFIPSWDNSLTDKKTTTSTT